MTDNILYHAAALRRKIAEAKAEYEMIEPQVLLEIEKLTADAEKKSVEVGDLGTFSLSPYSTWKYSDGVKTEEETVKAMKRQEEADGTAKKTERNIVKFIIPKPSLKKDE